MPKTASLKKYQEYYQDNSLIYMHKKALNKKNYNKKNSYYNTEPNNELEEKVNNLNNDLESIKVEYAWLESENMRNNLVLSDYHEKLLKLRKIQQELVEIVNQQAETIRTLKGYKKQPVVNNNKKNFFSFSIITLLPVTGMILTAIIEFIRLYNPALGHSIISFCMKLI